MPFYTLPQDIIDRYLLPLLVPDDILSLAQCVPLTISKHVYDTAFHTNSHFKHYDVQMFRRRARAKLYVFGNVHQGIAGLEKEHPETYEYIPVIKRHRTHSPLKIETVGTISQVEFGAKEVCVLISSGDIYLSRTSKEKPYMMLKAATWVNAEDGRDSTGIVWKNTISQDVIGLTMIACDDSEYGPVAVYEEDAPSPLTDLPPEVVQYSEEVITQPHRPSKFVDVAAGDRIYALDSTGRLWTWDEGVPEGIPLCMIDRGCRTLVTRPMLKLVQRDAVCTCLVKGLGIASILYFQEDFDYRSSPCMIRNGYRCLENQLCAVEVEFVPGTENVTEWAVCKRGIIILNADGSISTHPIRSVHRTNEFKKFSQVADKTNHLAPFCGVYSSRNMICLLTEDKHRVVVVTIQGHYEEASKNVISAPPGVTISSLAVAPFHFLALTENGDVYVWGRERKCSGCLGFGRFQDIIWRDDVTLGCEHPSLIVKEMTKIDLPGKAVEVFASKDRSGVLLEEQRD